MPNTASAKKADRQSVKRHSRNKHFLESYRDARKAFERALAGGAKITREEGDKFLSTLYSALDKLVKKNIIHSNNASRRKSQFSRKLKAVTTAA